MMDHSYLLPILLFLPLVSALAVALLPNERTARHVAFIASVLTSFLGALLAWRFFGHTDGWLAFWDFSDAPGFPEIGFHARMGVDALSVFLVLLICLTLPMSILGSFAGIQHRPREFYGWALVLMFATIGAFMARDLLLFYIFFELTLIPMFFLIGMWGGSDRRHAASRFFLYTFAGSIFTLAAIIYLGTSAKTYRIIDVIYYAQHYMSPAARFWCMMGLMVGFAIKAPLFPMHTWLPLAHTEAPTGGSVVLAALLLKLGAYGILVIAVPIGLIGADGVTFPGTLKVFAAICCVGIIYGALAAWVQNDIKKLIAYSSVSHMGMCVLGALALNDMGMSGSLLYMVNHGILTGAMFLLVGMVYERFHTRDIEIMSGLARRMPVYATFFVFFVMASVGLPGLNGFVSEFLSMLGAFTSESLGTVAFGAFAALGMIVGALYMLHLTAKIIFGPLKVPEPEHGAEEHEPQSLPQDINGREIAVLVPLALAVIVLGVMPNLVLKPIQRPLEELRTTVPRSRLAENSPWNHLELSSAPVGEREASSN